MHDLETLSSSALRPLHQLTLADVGQFGGKNASLGELISQLTQADVSVPAGFATSADAFRKHFAESGLDSAIEAIIAGLDVDDIDALSRAGQAVRELIESTPFSDEFEADIRSAYELLVAEAELAGATDVSVAVRSSATAEDLPDASFAGQQETYLNVRGADEVIAAARRVFASLYNDRAIAYRVHLGFEHSEVAMSVGVQRMIRSDIGAAGVLFTLDTETGFRDAVFVTSAYGLGEGVVQGAVNPDEFYVYKPALAEGRPAILKRSLGGKSIAMRYADGADGRTTVFEDVAPAERARFSINDAEVTELGRLAVAIERHYGKPMDIEWAKDGSDGRLYILQARPETVRARRDSATAERFVIDAAAAQAADVAVEGRAIGDRIGSGAVRVLNSPDQMAGFSVGDVLVADMTDPDWEPIMKRASAIVTNRGGRTCHAAIIARELGIPAIVGSGIATDVLAHGDVVTVDCSSGEAGVVYRGEIPFAIEREELGELPTPPVRLMLNVASPEQAFAFSQLPNWGVGLARLEFIISRQIGVHPRAILEPESVSAEVTERIAELSSAYASPRDFYVEKLVEGISTIAAAFAPKPVIVRLSDFKSNEYAHLVGGETFEPTEENPMIGFRGAGRYGSHAFRSSFALECEAIRFVRDQMGLRNVQVMVPFVRTVGQLQSVVDELALNGLVRGENDLRLIMMCEVPSNAVLADSFLDLVDGFSIGSNDLTQLTLGLDRDSALVADVFDERDPAVLALIELAVSACVRRGKYVGICGQGPSDHPDLAERLVDMGVNSMSLNPDSVVQVWRRLTAGS